MTLPRINHSVSIALSTLLLVTALPAYAGKYFQLEPEQRLGRLLYKDTKLSLNQNQSCASCHSLRRIQNLDSHKRLPSPGFVDPENVREGSPVSRGSVNGKLGTLNSPSSGYAAFSPFFHWDSNEGLYVGGQFWNGRAPTLAEQAKGPFLNPLEMAMPNKWAVVSRLKQNPRYVRLFMKLYELDLDTIPAYQEGMPVETIAPSGVDEVYEHLAKAIAAFEKSRFFNRFTSKFDFVLAGQTEFTDQEELGFALFTGKANCSACHVSEATIAPDNTVFPPLFTDFTFDNIGVPRNWNIPGQPEPDPGLGGREDIATRDPEGNELGKHKVMSLRNIAVTAPYAHNGVFSTLKEIVHFYNTRDTLGWVANNNDPGFAVTGWPEPEISKNVNDEELGNLGLTEAEEEALITFMKTLTDGYPRWGKDPNVPKGTPSPYANTPFPPLP